MIILYWGVFGTVPPCRSGLDVDCIGVNVSNEVSGSVCEGGWGIGSSDEPQFSISIGVLQNGDGIFKGIGSVSDSVPNITMEVWLSYPPVNDGSHY